MKDIDNTYIEESYEENLSEFVLIWFPTEEPQEKHDIENFLFDHEFKSTIRARKQFN